MCCGPREHLFHQINLSHFNANKQVGLPAGVVNGSGVTQARSSPPSLRTDLKKCLHGCWQLFGLEFSIGRSPRGKPDRVSPFRRSKVKRIPVKIRETTMDPKSHKPAQACTKWAGFNNVQLLSNRCPRCPEKGTLLVYNQDRSEHKENLTVLSDKAVSHLSATV